MTLDGRTWRVRRLGARVPRFTPIWPTSGTPRSASPAVAVAAVAAASVAVTILALLEIATVEISVERRSLPVSSNDGGHVRWQNGGGWCGECTAVCADVCL